MHLTYKLSSIDIKLLIFYIIFYCLLGICKLCIKIKLRLKQNLNSIELDNI